MEGTPRRLDGTNHPWNSTSVIIGPVSGVQIPFVLETHVLPVAGTATGLRDTPVPVEKITIERAVVNPKLDEALFAKPDPGAASGGNRWRRRRRGKLDAAKGARGHWSTGYQPSYNGLWALSITTLRASVLRDSRTRPP